MSAAFITVSAVGAITTAPTLVHSIYIMSAGGVPGATLTDGDGGEIIAKLGTTWANYVGGVVFPEPILVQHGLYLSAITATTYVMVSYS